MSRKIAVCLLVVFFFAATAPAPAQSGAEGLFGEIVQIRAPGHADGDPDGLTAGSPRPFGDTIREIYRMLIRSIIF